MELEELKKIWNEQEEKLNKSLQLNIQLLRKINFDKAGNKLRTLLFYKLTEMIILLFMIAYLWNFTIKYFNTPGFSVPSVILTGFIMAGFISDIRQVNIITQLRSEENAPVSFLQKKTEKLKLLIIGYVKMSFITIPFYPLLMIVGGKIFFNVDCWVPQHRSFLMANFITGLLLIPLFAWLYRQLSKHNIKQVWVDNFLTGSGWNQADAAHKFLAEIAAFEKEENA
jgi:hypothetical protein